MYKIVLYKNESGKEIVGNFINSFSNKIIVKIRFEIRLLKEYGLFLLSTSKIKKILGIRNLYELRIKTSVQIRLFFVYFPQNTFLIIHGFIKKTNKTPSKEIEIAVDRKKEFDIT